MTISGTGFQPVNVQPATREHVPPTPQWWGTIEYEPALERMNAAHTDRVAGRITDSFFYLEHPPVITYGRATPATDIKPTAGNIPAREVPRGGLATYHAPGQLVGYIVMDLSNRVNGARPDIHAYLRAIEVGLIAFLKDAFNFDAGLREGYTGVWTLPSVDAPAGRKLASIGVNARKWVTSHGFALNIHPDMSGFERIIPCGITDAPMTSVELELQRNDKSFTPRPLQDWAIQAHEHLVKAFQNEGWLLN